jgi:hypothetical protein
MVLWYPGLRIPVIKRRHVSRKTDLSGKFCEKMRGKENCRNEADSINDPGNLSPHLEKI